MAVNRPHTDALTSIEIPDSVTSIGDYAFYGCDNLTIYGISGSYAQNYANENDIPFVASVPSITPVATPVPTEKPAIEPTAEPNAGEIAVKPDSGYTLDLENGMLSGVAEKTSLKELEEKLENGESVVVTKANGENVTDENALIGTGYIIKIVDENGKEKESVAVVVLGDTTGDALANSRDIAAMQKHIIEIQKLEGVYLTASDLKADGALNSRDIAQLQKKLIADTNK